MYPHGEGYVGVQDPDLVSKWMELKENPVIWAVDTMLMNTISTDNPWHSKEFWALSVESFFWQILREHLRFVSLYPLYPKENAWLF